MTEVKKYWRDKVSQLLGWATGLVFIFVGWATEQHDKFEIGPWSQGGSTPDQTRDAAVRAVFLIMLGSIYSLLLPFAIMWIYNHFLSEGVDETVISKSKAFYYSVFLSMLSISIAILASCM